MSRQIKDIKDKNTGLLVYPKTHIKAVVVDSNTNLEDFLGEDMGNRLDTLESIIKTDGSGNLYLSDDGSYKEIVSLKFENVSTSVWVDDATYPDFPYRCDITCNGVFETDYAEVVFALELAISGEYAPICETKDNIVSIWSKSDKIITIPVIIILK